MNVSCWAIEGGAFGMAVCDYPGGLTTLRKGDGPTDAATYGEIGHSDLGALTAGHYVLQSTIYDATSPNPRTQTISFDVADAGRVSDGAPYGLEPVGRNPARGTFSVAAILSGDAPATVTVYDVRGRLVTSVKLDGIGLRRQPVRFGADHPFPAGVYFVRLAQGRRLAQLKQVVLQ
jgi:hypothetical protein